MQNIPLCDTNSIDINKTDLPVDENGINTQQIHALLLTEQQNNHKSSFDKAIRKQQQLFTICSTLERQNALLNELEDLLNSNNGVYWLDTQIQQFKDFCPSSIFTQLSKSSNDSIHKIEHSEIINLSFFNLINDIFYIPLNALTKIKTGLMNECERKQWYEWCLKIDQQLVMFKVQIISAQSFFCEKSFDKIYNLAKDDTIKQQLGNVEHLFQQKTSSTEGVECKDESI